MNTRPSYVNQAEVEFYYEQYDIKKHIKTASKTTIEASLAGPKASQQFETVERDLSTVRKVEALWDYLKDNSLLGYDRPNTVEEQESSSTEFIFETVVAHKLVFLKDKVANIEGLNQLVVWIAEPDTNYLSEEPYAFSGTFLILIEALYDKEGFTNNLSGCSALQALHNTIDGKPTLTVNWDEPLGRKNSSHPLEKLQSIGAIYLKKQEIKTIYRHLYMSNEQVFTSDNKKYRCNDLLAYPLFIV